MDKIKKGDRVRQIMPLPVEGVVTEFHVCQNSGVVSVTVASPRDDDGDGHPDLRAFTLDQLELVK